MVVDVGTTAAGLALFALPGIGGSSWSTFFPPMATVGLGMAMSVTPLTTLVLDAIAPLEVGIASGINSTCARLASLLAVAIIGVLTLALFTPALRPVSGVRCAASFASTGTDP